MSKNKIILIIGVVFLFALGVAWQLKYRLLMQSTNISTFEDCAKAGKPITGSYPRQCKNGDDNFIENIGNQLEKKDIIFVSSLKPNDAVESPLVITGKARGAWFFEGSFPVILTDDSGVTITQGTAKAEGSWMTKEFVPFTVKLEFTSQTGINKKGNLILKKDNPSGLPENDDNLQIPVYFKL